MKSRMIQISLAAVMLMAGCSTKEAESSESAGPMTFKQEYEALNGTENKAGKENRTVDIPDDNPFVVTSAEDIVARAQNKETFFVYYGDPLCPWCRSVVEEAIATAKADHIETIYYVDMWDDDGNEIVRDKYQLENGQIEKVSDGSDAYMQTLQLFDNVIDEYTLKDEHGTTYNVGEKRIFLPSYIYVENGTAVRMEEGISLKQNDARDELTDEIRQDEDQLFHTFFTGA